METLNKTLKYETLWEQYEKGRKRCILEKPFEDSNLNTSKRKRIRTKYSFYLKKNATAEVCKFSKRKKRSKTTLKKPGKIDWLVIKQNCYLCD